MESLADGMWTLRLESALLWASLIVGVLVLVSWLLGKGCFRAERLPLETSKKQQI